MEITRRCDYACRILRAAYRHGEGYISISDVAEAEGIPYAFARSIQHDLATAGYIKTVRGAHGGLTLEMDPGQITLLDVLTALQGDVSLSQCVGDPTSCINSCDCVYNKVWMAADRLLNDYFASITLEDLFSMGGNHPSILKVLNETSPSVDDVPLQACAACPAGKGIAAAILE